MPRGGVAALGRWGLADLAVGGHSVEICSYSDSLEYLLDNKFNFMDARARQVFKISLLVSD